MSDQAALLNAIRTNPDEDTPRLLYADWLDENLPDKTPSPAAGPSARAEYIRVQVRLAQLPFDDPDYPELLERQDDLAEWLNAHASDDEKQVTVPDVFDWFGEFDGGEYRNYDRGFPNTVEFSEYDDEPDENVETITEHLPEVFEKTTIRALEMDEAYGAEIEGVANHPCAAGLRGFRVSSLADDDDDKAVRAIGTSKHLAHLRHLGLELGLDDESLKVLAKATNLGALESFTIDFNNAEELKALGTARWFRNLRYLRVYVDDRDALKALAELPTMPNLVSLAWRSWTAPTAVAVRRFAASKSFPRLARLEIDNERFTPALTALLATGEWPLRHLKLEDVPVQKAGAEALARAPFAETLRVLDLPRCGITPGGIQALAASEKLAGLKHLRLLGNPIGVGGLTALARSKHLHGLRGLTLDRCNSTKAPISAAAMYQFLSALEMPELRHLKIDQLPVGIRGARVIADGGTFANLTRLEVNECGLQEKGARALVETPNLPHLTVLDMRENRAGKGLTKLANSAVHPRLGRAFLGDNRVPKALLTRLGKRPGLSM